MWPTSFHSANTKQQLSLLSFTEHLGHYQRVPTIDFVKEAFGMKQELPVDPIVVDACCLTGRESNQHLPFTLIG